MFRKHTLKSLKQLVRDKTIEGVDLEFKRSEVLQKCDVKSVSKTICAFANSIGGVIIYGVAEKDSCADSLDGGYQGKDRKDWLLDIASRNIKPAVNGVQVRRINDNSRVYYQVSVPKSMDAPHQANDNKYYKRSGSHSLPLEHYEIEDIRYRSLIEYDPITARLVFEQRTVVVLQLANVSKMALFDVTVKFQPDYADTKVPSDLERLKEKRYQIFHAGVEHRYWLGQTFELMAGDSENKMLKCKVSYSDGVKRHTKSFQFDFDDFKDDLIPRIESDEQLKSIAKHLEKIAKVQSDIEKTVKKISDSFEPTGIRLAHSTLTRLDGKSSDIPTVNLLHLGLKPASELLGLQGKDCDTFKKLFNALRFEPAKAAEIFDSLTENAKSSYLKLFDSPQEFEQ